MESSKQYVYKLVSESKPVTHNIVKQAMADTSHDVRVPERIKKLKTKLMKPKRTFNSMPTYGQIEQGIMKTKPMEKPTIEIMNSVIAEYMGYTPIQNETMLSKPMGDTIAILNLNELRYNLNMNLLYPVWQKLLTQHKLSALYQELPIKTILIIEELFGQAAPISELHEAIYNAIVWLNNNKK